MDDEARSPYEARPLPDGLELIGMATDRPDFQVRTVDGVAALSYQYLTSDPEQFEFPRSEMRGLLIDTATGEILARPFQKFWNVHEGGSAGTDWSEPHTVLPKIDGSMAVPFPHPRRGMLWATKGGETSTSRAAALHARTCGDTLDRLIDTWNGAGRTDGPRHTLIFEFTDAEKPIVIRYRASRLTLLAVRRIDDGRYVPHDEMIRVFNRIAEPVSVDGDGPLGVIRSLDPPGEPTGDPKVLIERVRSWPASAQQEGVVVAFEGGHRVKIKSDAYLRLHRARDQYSMEHRVLSVWPDAEERAALLGNLETKRAERLKAWFDAVDRAADEAAASIAAEVNGCAAGGVDRKTAAERWTALTAANGPRRTIGFAAMSDALDGGTTPERVRTDIEKWVRKKSRRETNVDGSIRPLIPGVERWAPPDGNDGE